MQAPWIFSSTFLPYTGEPIDFLLKDRSEPLHGTFGNGMFHSRWADYGADRVQSWRGSDADQVVAPMGMPKVATAGAFITTWRRLTSAVSGRRSAVPTVSPHRHSRTTALSVVPKGPADGVTRCIDSNQISS